MHGTAQAQLGQPGQPLPVRHDLPDDPRELFAIELPPEPTTNIFGRRKIHNTQRDDVSPSAVARWINQGAEHPKTEIHSTRAARKTRNPQPAAADAASFLVADPEMPAAVVPPPASTEPRKRPAWTPERRAKFTATMRAKRLHLPPPKITPVPSTTRSKEKRVGVGAASTPTRRFSVPPDALESIATCRGMQIFGDLAVCGCGETILRRHEPGGGMEYLRSRRHQKDYIAAFNPNYRGDWMTMQASSTTAGRSADYAPTPGSRAAWRTGLAGNVATLRPAARSGSASAGCSALPHFAYPRHSRRKDTTMKRAMLVMAMIGFLFTGCSQETGKNSTAEQIKPNYATSQPSRQTELTKGHQVTLNFYNAPGRGVLTPASTDIDYAMPSPKSGAVPQRPPSTQPATRAPSTSEEAALAELRAGYVQRISSITINLGDNTASATQSPTQTPTAGAITSTQNPSTSGTLQPQTQVNPTIAAGMPGSAVSATGGGPAGWGSGAVTGGPQTTSPTQTPLYTTISAPASALGTILQSLGSYLGQLATNAQAIAVTPAAAPAVTVPPTTAAQPAKTEPTSKPTQ